MKKIYYTICLTAFVAVFGVSYYQLKNKKEKLPDFKERKGVVALSAEWVNTKNAIQGLLSEIRRDPSNYQAKINLAQVYIQEGRITGDHAHYDKAALDLLKPVLKAHPNNFEALCCKATVLLSQHHFNEALEVAKNALRQNPSNAYIYGLLCDAYVELGNYSEAVRMADKMVSIRPDLRSYSRVSYLREIHGDITGAIEAMKLAVSAGYPGLEQTCWSRVILGKLYENTGDLFHAEEQYQLALYERPGYAYALAGISSIEKSKKNYKESINNITKALQQVNDPDFQDQLTDIYIVSGRSKDANRSAEKVIETLAGTNGDESEEAHGHYADKELAYAYLKTYKYDLALKHALAEYERRPENIEACEALAWVRYKRGEYIEADKVMTKAVRMKTFNPVLMCRAGLIKLKVGNKNEGVALIQKSMADNPQLDPMLIKEVKPIIASL